jgi:hypothetical protein
MGMRLIGFFSPGRCGPVIAGFRRLPGLIPDSQVFPPGPSSRDGMLEGKDESGPESTVLAHGPRLSP